MVKKNSLDLDRVAFIGRTFREYTRMFDLDESDLKRGPVLDCVGGPSSFTAEAHALGVDAAAVDLLYDHPSEILADKGRRDIAHVFQKVAEVPQLYVWKYYRDSDEIIGLRRQALETFVKDFPKGLQEGRYTKAALPRLPFPDKSFTLVLSSHFLFLYGDRLSLDFHIQSLKEMMRVSSAEVRIYPLQGLDAKPYPRMNEVLERLRSEGIKAEIVPTQFEFQRGAINMMRIYR